MDNSSRHVTDLLDLTVEIVSAHVANNSVAVGELPELIVGVYASLTGLGVKNEPQDVVPEPAVPSRRSVRPDYIVCLEDGKKLKMLKRHLMTRYQMTPEQYRTKWNLPADYPMVAPDYAEYRRTLAKEIGLGRKPSAPKAKPAPAAPKEARAQRKKLSLALGH